MYVYFIFTIKFTKFIIVAYYSTTVAAAIVVNRQFQHLFEKIICYFKFEL